MIMRQRSE